MGRGANLTTRFCDRLGIGYTKLSTDDPDAGWKLLRHELDAGRPVLCWADMRELPYLNVRMQMSRHDIVVIGYDDTTGTVQVVDNDRPEIQTIGQHDLARARRSTGFPEPTRHTCYPMHFPLRLPDPTAAAITAMRDTIANMHGIDQPNMLPAGLPGAIEGIGLDGVDQFAADIATWPGIWDDEELNAAHRTLAVFIQKAGTGGSLFRRLQTEFFADLHGIVGHPAVAVAHDAWYQVEYTWLRLAQFASNSAEPRMRHRALTSIAARLPRQERTAVEHTERAAKALHAIPPGEGLNDK